MELLEYIIRVRGGRQARREATEAATGLEALQHAEHEAGEEAAQATPKLLFFTEALKQVEKNTGGVRTNIFGLSGRLGQLAQMAALASPAILGLSGALIAVAGSAAAAAGGAAAIGVGGVGALTVGLGSLAAVAAPVVSGLKDVKTAQDQYNLAIQQYGYWSKEAGTAQDHLNAVVRQSGGSQLLRIIDQWHSLTRAFRENTREARRSLIGTVGQAMTAGQRLVPAFSNVANTSAAAVSRGLRGAFSQLSGPGVQGMLINLGQVFANISQSAIRAGTDLFIAVGRVAVAAGPYVEMVGEGIARWAHSLRGATSDGRRLDGIVGTLVGHLRSWWDLTKAVGRVFFILLGTGAESGKGLVDSLTGVVNKFGDWLQKMRDTGQLQKFFKDSVALVRELASAAAAVVIPMLRLVRTALPPFTATLRWLRPVLPEIVGLFIGWRVAVWGLNSASRAATAIERWRTLIRTLRTLRFPNFAAIGRRGGTAFGRAFGLAASTAIAVGLGKLFTHISDKLNVAGGKRGRQSRARWIDEHIPGMKQLRDLGESLGLDDVPGAANGAMVRARGALLVGENGPEIIDAPQGARVSPLTPGGDIILKVSGREIARVTNREIRDQQARGA